MKCPKCGYLGFETVDRCRNCGYDFSLASSEVERRASSDVERAAPSGAERPVSSGAERRGESHAEGRGPGLVDELAPSKPEALPDHPNADLTLHDTPQPSNALAEYELEDKQASTVTPSVDPVMIHGKSGLDLDRLIGVPEDEPAGTLRDEPARTDPVLNPPRPFNVSDEHTPLLDAVEAESEGATLPLFGRARVGREAEESPMVAPPRPAGPPLAVRRATPEVARPRNRAPRTTRRDEPPLSFSFGGPMIARPSNLPVAPSEESTAPFEMASRIARVTAALIDLALLAGICFAVLYLTLRIANLTFDDVRVLPVVPMAAFLILLVAGYLIAFTAAGGQTIGKMATGIKVIGEDGRPVDVSSAVLRLAGNAVNIATLGLAWLPALFAADGRSLADRLAGTRVIRA